MILKAVQGLTLQQGLNYLALIGLLADHHPILNLSVDNRPFYPILCVSVLKDGGLCEFP
jgi:hypothetical protein